MSEEESIKCINCKQYIAKSKMFLHEGFCLKNNKYCPECDKIFLIQEFEEHLKTHTVKKANPPQEKKPPKIQEKKVIINQKEKSAISEHRKNCKHDKKEPVPKGSPKPERPKIKPRIIDDNLGVRRCEFCDNMVENLPEHLKECKVKKMIEEENAKYYKDLEKRNREDDKLAQKLAKEKIMDVSKDEQMAKNLQKNLKPMIDTSKDEQMARNLQKKLKPMVDTSKDEIMARNLQGQLKPMVDTSQDEMMARKLQMQFGQMTNNISKDEQMARELQKQFGDINVNYEKDEQMARMLEQQEQDRRRRNRRNNQNNNNNNNYNDMDEELRRAIEQSKKDFYK
jgi:hypothetical protein